MSVPVSIQPKQLKLKKDRFTSNFKAIESDLKRMRCGVTNQIPFNRVDSYPVLKAMPSEEKIEMLYSLIHRMNYYEWPKKGDGTGVTNSYFIYSGLLKALMRAKIDFPKGYAFSAFFRLLYDGSRFSDSSTGLDRRPIDLLVSQIEKHEKQYGLYDDLKVEVGKILDHELVKPQLNVVSSKPSYGPDFGKAVQKLKVLVFDDKNASAPFELGSGMVSGILEKAIIESNDVDKWHTLFHHLALAKGAKPSKSFSQTTNSIVDDIGSKSYKTTVNSWLAEIASRPVNITKHTIKNSDYTYTTYEYIEDQLYDLLKGLCWSMSRYHDEQTLKNLAALAEKCFQKVPETGPAAAAVGNAGIYALGHSKGLEGISHLSRLKLRIQQNNTQNLIQKYIDAQAERLDISSIQVEEQAAPDFGLQDGVRTEKFDDYTLRLSMVAVGQTELQWIKPDGTKQKSVPAFVKNNAKSSGKLKKMRDLAKQIQKASVTQRDRIDRFYTESLSWDIDTFNQYYLHHGLISQIAKNLIWQLNGVPGLFYEEHWQDCHGKPIDLDDQVSIALWHPIDSDSTIVLQWRDRLEALEIKQPFKQAYREIYILTDAEINTEIYSNRMAAHILKQHQFNSLSALRGWTYSLLGSYDDGKDGEIASKTIAAHHLTAQFWINEILDDAESFNDAGIWHYVATDQIRFNNEADEAVPLVDVPAIVLSEIMRDADLFVGVASVGNDPTWQDGGPTERPVYRDYWQGYAFGDLNEVAKTRKQVLESMLPKLKINDVAKIDGKFLIVVGKINSYKIHIGSGNILITPSDRYVCVVPSRGKDRNLQQIFLPFEGDQGLSIVLSKAFLLAADDKITDETILSQIKN